MRTKFVIFFTLLMGLFFVIVKGESDSQQKIFGDPIDLEAQSYAPDSEDLFCVVWARLQNVVGVISGPYLLKKLSELVSEYPMKSMVMAIIIGIITNENKENIFRGVKRLRNSVYRVIGFGLKESKKDKKSEEIKFVERAVLDDDKVSSSGNFFVVDV